MIDKEILRKLERFVHGESSGSEARSLIQRIVEDKELVETFEQVVREDRMIREPGMESGPGATSRVVLPTSRSPTRTRYSQEPRRGTPCTGSGAERPTKARSSSGCSTTRSRPGRSGTRRPANRTR